MELIDYIMEWEKKNNFFEIGNVRGFDFYSYLRRELVNTSVNSKNKVKTDPFAAKGQKDTGIKLFLKLLKRSEKTSVKNPDLLILCHPRRQREGDVYESVFTDFLEEEFPNSLTFERLFDDHSHFEPAKTRQLCYIDRITLISYVSRIFASKFKRSEYEAVKGEIRAIMDGPMREFEQQHGIDMKRETYYERAVTLYYFWRSRKKRLGKFLDRVKPKLVAEVVSKSADAMLINELAHERGIKVVELQHSLLGPIARYPEGIREKQSPDYYLSYSDYWSDYQSYPIAEENVHACGSPYFERQVKKYKALDSSAWQEKKDPSVKRVLFISATVYGKPLARLAMEFKKLAGDRADIVYKLHPDEFGCWRELYPELAESGLRVVDSKDIGIYEFFKGADVQVGVFSTALYEGLGFDLKTCILDNDFAGEFRDFCRDGYGSLVADEKQLYDAVFSPQEDESHENISEKFWKSGARENIVRELRKILAK